MRRILHLSDLHFGRSTPALETPLLQAIHQLEPDLVVISGDFTQRARVSQFIQAREFVERIEAPVLSVPGNHDTPLDNLFMRFFKPFSRYKRYINRNLEPMFEDSEISVVGVNTVNRFAWQSGKFAERTVQRVCGTFEDASARLRIAVLHHPLEHGPEVDKRPVKGGRKALRGLENCGADVVLSGHLHTASIAPFTAAPGLLCVQAGTGLSTRLRGELNTFNMLVTSPERVVVTTWAARWPEDGQAPVFEAAGSTVHRRQSHGADLISRDGMRFQSANVADAATEETEAREANSG
ncbi:metallophosphoesterase [Pseudooceanicola sediminis]|uniref:Metallophosphoesterase n=1 Tax=Pseudooceanicola sediminis TaxID=2211117 RepID=A0A399JBP7_9RHOB|nr:metallophosphoesterase family protein [Pseudooceanicola sediminis]KAA2311502.1 metallophosphoesterase [Puniceibacterium sp. HSS470]RII40056.1 metallophosphoesterase [Pseudooceanicola sediminis]|tara:strand:- start:131110 stop:131994 length:885 start_codon:yes stop_codon:yes gene_type:complete